jgi:hypothetical protein
VSSSLGVLDAPFATSFGANSIATSGSVVDFADLEASSPSVGSAFVSVFVGALLDLDLNPRVFADSVVFEYTIFLVEVLADSSFVFLAFLSTSLSGGLVTMVLGDSDPSLDALGDASDSVFDFTFLVVGDSAVGLEGSSTTSFKVSTDHSSISSDVVLLVDVLEISVVSLDGLGHLSTS